MIRFLTYVQIRISLDLHIENRLSIGPFPEFRRFVIVTLRLAKNVILNHLLRFYILNLCILP